ncbi:hypothetical protein GTW43_04785 [Streptomyces sp. SID5785]|uniref:hypothetical protein n=1 Tax=Streptomyces sp. SID5785 TaxID=2690309 RepID=UPI001361A580|nr:hypothetical protein [Streptomyces sp. SID5785]MZD04397.1 hypothetical protein [Streptomyces sp. SID5785]
MPRTTRRRALAAALLACALAGGTAGCGDDDGGPRRVGTLLDRTDDEGHRYREIPDRDAPEVGVTVQPDRDPARGWDVRLRVRHFRLSPAGTGAHAVHGRGYVRLYLDGHPLARLGAPVHRLAQDRIGRGTHQVTVRLYADDDTVWAVGGRAVEATADLTSSGPGTTPSPVG